MVVDYFAHMADSRRHEFVKLLVKPGKDSPPTLGGYVNSEEASYKATKKSQQSSIFIVSTLLHCCCTMLTNPYPYKVLFSTLRRN